MTDVFITSEANTGGTSVYVLQGMYPHWLKV